MNKFLQKYIYFILIAVLFTGVGGFLMDRLGGLNPKVSYAVRAKNETYNFINPILFYDGPSDQKDYTALSAKTQRIINDFVGRQPKSRISLYYRDLTNGRWFGINEDDKYNPASLLKIVIMIAYLKQSESEPGFLSRQIKFSQDIKSLIGAIPYDQGTGLELNKYYSAESLIEKMIIKSDNGAAYALLSILKQDDLNQIYGDLGLGNPSEKGRDYTISPKNYASFLRILFNATYLDRPMSERALDLLSQSDFKDGLVAGMPGNVRVSHKYGENISTSKDGSIDQIELHDCGIIYRPAGPYLLCVMTRGKNMSDLEGVIQNISKIFFDNFK